MMLRFAAQVRSRSWNACHTAHSHRRNEMTKLSFSRHAGVLFAVLDLARWFSHTVHEFTNFHFLKRPSSCTADSGSRNGRNRLKKLKEESIHVPENFSQSFLD